MSQYPLISPTSVSQYAKILLHVDLFQFLNFECSCYSFSFYFVGVCAKRKACFRCLAFVEYGYNANRNVFRG